MALIKHIPSTSGNFPANVLQEVCTGTSTHQIVSDAVTLTNSGSFDKCFVMNSSAYSSLYFTSNNFLSGGVTSVKNGNIVRNVPFSGASTGTADISDSDFIIINLTGSSISSIAFTFS